MFNSDYSPPKVDLSLGKHKMAYYLLLTMAPSESVPRCRYPTLTNIKLKSSKTVTTGITSIFWSLFTSHFDNFADSTEEESDCEDCSIWHFS